jgi:hypothetical protein
MKKNESFHLNMSIFQVKKRKLVIPISNDSPKRERERERERKPYGNYR